MSEHRTKSKKQFEGIADGGRIWSLTAARVLREGISRPSPLPAPVALRVADEVTLALQPVFADLAARCDRIEAALAALALAAPGRRMALVEAIADYFGDGVFTARGVLEAVEDEPHSPLAEALAAVVDMNASPQGRATRLGQVLARLDELELVGERRGAAVYRLRS